MPHPYTNLIRPLKRAAERVSLEHALSEAEKSVLASMLMGLNNKDIAQTLNVSRADVKWCAHQILTKSGHASREALTREVLLHELKHYRDRVQVCDLDIVAAGLGDPEVCVDSPHLLAWISSRGEFRNSPGVGIYRTHANGDEQLVHQGSPMAHDYIVNTLAEAVGRAPLDVLDEITQALD